MQWTIIQRRSTKVYRYVGVGIFMVVCACVQCILNPQSTRKEQYVIHKLNIVLLPVLRGAWGAIKLRWIGIHRVSMRLSGIWLWFVSIVVGCIPFSPGNFQLIPNLKHSHVISCERARSISILHQSSPWVRLFGVFVFIQPCQVCTIYIYIVLFKRSDILFSLLKDLREIDFLPTSRKFVSMLAVEFCLGIAPKYQQVNICRSGVDQNNMWIDIRYVVCKCMGQKVGSNKEVHGQHVEFYSLQPGTLGTGATNNFYGQPGRLWNPQQSVSTLQQWKKHAAIQSWSGR